MSDRTDTDRDIDGDADGGAAAAPDRRQLARHEATVRRGFWPKVRRTLGRVPFLDDALAAYYCATDRRTPSYVRAVLLGALAYFVVPTDMVPDFIAGFGFADDASVLMAAIAAVRKHVTPEHRARAEAALRALTEDGEAERS